MLMGKEEGLPADQKDAENDLYAGVRSQCGQRDFAVPAISAFPAGMTTTPAYRQFPSFGRKRPVHLFPRTAAVLFGKEFPTGDWPAGRPPSVI